MEQPRNAAGQNDNDAVPVTIVPAAVPIPRPFPDTSKIETFDRRNFRLWQERIYSVLDMHGEAHKIWESLILKYTAEDAGKQKFVVGNFYKWEMTEEKDIKLQINEYHKLLEELRAEKINLPDEFVAGILIEKLPETWSDYKQQLKHKQKQLSLSDLITHIIIEDINRKAIQAVKGKEIVAKANLVESKPRSKRYDPKNKNNKNKKYDYKSKDSNPQFKKKGNCFVYGKLGHYAAQCRKRATQKVDNPPKPNVNLVEGDNGSDDEVIAAVVSQALIVTDVKKWVVDSRATKHICANKEMFTSFEKGKTTSTSLTPELPRFREREKWY
ncbi:uncharacterized protein LOC114746065 [Neltuma alba]|uniref:uncharacterized protein LOC114746065 n=1 Tax=Neltuma alba TaxID=207710 RepID=UPI0010A2CCD4|nr:uncharacterized protein LOC114746065 [Prosopis alba]